jgi:hypothetical protein
VAVHGLANRRGNTAQFLDSIFAEFFMKRRGRLFLFLLLAMGIGLWYLWPRLQSSVTLQNRGGQTIKWITITNGPESERLTEIAAGESRVLSLHVGEENPFTIRGEFADGRPLVETLSKLTIKSHEPGQQIVITVTPDGTVHVDLPPPKG